MLEIASWKIFKFISKPSLKTASNENIFKSV